MVASPVTDRNLLFGILALQMDFVDRDALVGAMNAWLLEKTRSLGDILVEQRALTGDRHALLDALVQEHLGQPEHDPHATVLPPGDSATCTDEGDPYATHAATPGTAPPWFTPRFQILRRHAEGGLGEVFVARDSELQREVALKEIKGRYADDPDSRARFLLEAEITGRLEHPGVVPVYGLGTYPDGRPFYAMRFIQGESLKAAIERYHWARAKHGDPGERALALRTLLRRFLDVCNAVAYAHSRGILHRDLKPDNIMLGRFGETLVVDWGLAKVMGTATQPSVESSEEPIQPASGSGTAPTMMGRAVGTPQYMSPEQAAGQLDRLSPTSDVYSLGATLYNLLTGRAPFAGADSCSVLQRVRVGDFAPPGQLATALPRALEAICLKAMAHKPQDRYASALELAADLEHWLADEPVTACPDTFSASAARWVRRHRSFVVGCAALLVTAIGALALELATAKREQAHTEQQKQLVEDAYGQAQRALEESQEQRLRLTIGQGVHFLNDGDLLQALPWFAEALRLDQGQPARERMHRLRLTAVFHQCPRLTSLQFHDNQVNHAEFSPDGRWVVSAGADQRVRVWDTINRVGRSLAHRQAVLHAAFSPDSRWLVTACEDGTARVWRTETGEAVGAILMHDGPVRLASFSPDGHHILTATARGTAHVWETSTGRQLGVVRHDGPLTGAWFSPDGRSFLTTSEDHSARVWTAATLQPEGAPLPHAGPVSHAAFSPDGRRVATSSQDGTACIWDRATSQRLTPVLKHRDGVLWVTFSPEGHLVATAGLDRVARIWDASTGQLLVSSIRHGGPIVQVHFSPDGRRVVTASDDDTARIWDWITEEPVSAPLQHNGGVLCASFASDGRRLVTAGEDGTVRVWDTTRSESFGMSLPHRHDVLDAAFSPDGRWVATAEQDDTVRFWDPRSGDPQGASLVHKGLALLAFSPDGRWLASASRDGTIRLWHATTGQPSLYTLRHEANIVQLAFSADSRRLLTVGADRRVRVWNPETGDETAPPLIHDGSVNSAAFSLDGRRLVTACDDHTARLWDAVSGRALGSLCHGDVVYRAEFSPDSRRVLTASADRTAQLWDVVTATRLPCAPQHGSKVFLATFSPDGRRVLTASDDDSARVWDAETGQPLTPPMEHRASVLGATFSPEGECVLTFCEGHSVRVWDAATGQPLAPAWRHHGSILRGAFSPDGQAVLSVSPTGCRLWRLSAEDRPVEDFTSLAQLLVQARIDPTGGLVPLKPDEARRIWEKLKPKYAGIRESAPADILRWHRAEAQECRVLGYDFGATWHQARLAELTLESRR
jgi:WD40 repeat protein/tRNA A-37 threonylcarbamoyl transferase component Bud32